MTSETGEHPTIGPVTSLSINLESIVGKKDSLARVRVVPAGRNGDRVYGRTLYRGERDSGQGVSLEAGETLEFPAGSISVTLADVDRDSELGADRYAPVTNTIWSWLNIPPYELCPTFGNYLLAIGRRLDSAHAHCTSALRVLAARTEGMHSTVRQERFDALGNAETMCIALHRAMRMICGARDAIFSESPVPYEIRSIEDTVRAMRDAFEHIDERAVGKAHRENAADAMSVFDQSEFFDSGVIHYAGHSLDLRQEAIPAIVAGRKFIIESTTRAGLRKTVNQPFAWTFSQE